MNKISSVFELEDFSKYNGEGTVLRKAQKRLLEMLIDFDSVCKKYDITYFLSGGTCLGAVRHGGFIPWDDDIDIDIWHGDYKKLVNVLQKELSESYFVQTYESNKAFGRKYIRLVDKKSKVIYEDNSTRDNFIHQGLWLDILPLDKCISYRLKKIIDYFYVGSMMNNGVKKGRYFKRFASIWIYPFAKLSAIFLSKISSKFGKDNKICHILGTGMAPRLKKKNCFPTKKIIFEEHEFLGPANPHDYLVDLYGENYMNIPSESKRKTHSAQIELE